MSTAENNKRYLFLMPAMLIMTAFILSLLGSTAMADQAAVVATVAADYSSGAHSTISVDPVGGPRTASNNLAATATSDLTVVAYGNYFYRIGKYFADHVTKYSIDAPATPVWQYSTLNNPTDPSSNPQDMIFVNDLKAYIPRYETTTVWIVNPSAATEAEFKIGELDLSAYDDGDGSPEMRSAVIAGKKLFIALQRMTRTDWPDPWQTNTAYVAVFDTETDTEIDTGLGEGDMKGIPLEITNLNAIQYLPANNSIYVQGVGRYETEYTGGIVSINPNTYAAGMVLDDGDDAEHPYGNISGMVIVSPSKGYFVGYAGWGDNTLYAFDPSADNPTGVAVNGLENKNIAGMESGVYTDENGLLWICNQTDHRVDIVNTEDNTIDESMDTSLDPVKVVFVGGRAGKAGSSSGGGGGCFVNALLP